MAINLLKRTEIDEDWWNGIIRQSDVPMPYAESWYLDMTAAGQWIALVDEEGEIVMPLAVKKRGGILCQGYQPAFTQQLGVFGKGIDEDKVAQFIDSLPRCIVISTHLNEGNPLLSSNKGIWRKQLNLILNLEKDINSLRSGFAKSLRKRIRRGREELRVIESTETQIVVDFFNKQMDAQLQISDYNYQLITNIIDTAIQRKQGRIWLAYDEQEVLQGACFFLLGTNRIINLFGTSDKGTNAMQVILDEVISEYAGQSYYFDFEGSELPGVASFFRSFGSEERDYYRYDYSPIPGLAKWMHKR